MGWFRPEYGSVREEQKQECAAVRSTGALSRLTAVVVEKCLNIAVLLVVFTMVFGVGKMLDAGWSVMGWINRTLGQDSTGEVAGGTSQGPYRRMSRQPRVLKMRASVSSGTT